MGVLVLCKCPGLTCRAIVQIIQATFEDLIRGDKGPLERLQALLYWLPAHEQRTILYVLIEVLSKERLNPEASSAKSKTQVGTKIQKGVAALLATLITGNPDLQASLTDWLVNVSANAATQNHIAHRAVIVVIAKYSGQSFRINHKLRLTVNL